MLSGWDYHQYLTFISHCGLPCTRHKSEKNQASFITIHLSTSLLRITVRSYSYSASAVLREKSRFVHNYLSQYAVLPNPFSTPSLPCSPSRCPSPLHHGPISLRRPVPHRQQRPHRYALACRKIPKRPHRSLALSRGGGAGGGLRQGDECASGGEVVGDCGGGDCGGGGRRGSERRGGGRSLCDCQTKGRRKRRVDWFAYWRHLSAGRGHGGVLW